MRQITTRMISIKSRYVFAFLMAAILPMFSGISVARTFQTKDVEDALKNIIVESTKSVSAQHSTTITERQAFRELNYLIEAGTIATPSLLRAVADRANDWKLRRMLLRDVLGVVKDKNAELQVSRILEDKRENLSVRSAAATVLGKISGKESLATLKSVANDSFDNEEFQSSILRAFADVGKPDGIEVVRKRLTHKNPFIKTVAVRALYKLALNTKDMSQLEPLVDMVDDSKFENRNVVIKLLGEAKEKQALSVILKVAKNEQEAYIYRCAAVEAVGNIGGESAEKELINLLSDTDELVRGYAADGLAKGEYSSNKIVKLRAADEQTKDSYIKKKIVAAIAKLESK